MPTDAQRLLRRWQELAAKVRDLRAELLAAQRAEGVARQRLYGALERLSPEVTPRVTARELQVLRAVIQGSANKEIGTGLHISERTVKYYISILLKKFEVQDRYQLAARCNSLLLGDRAPAELMQ